VLLLATGAPALASPPAVWGPEPSVPALQALLVYLVIPVGLFVLITLLVYIPSMTRGAKYQPGQAWRNEPQWFGGPRAGVDAANETQAAAEQSEGAERGGASARW
jgi:hypothetical protein